MSACVLPLLLSILLILVLLLPVKKWPHACWHMFSDCTRNVDILSFVRCQFPFLTLSHFHPLISLKPLSIWHEKCTYSLVANYFKKRWKKNLEYGLMNSICFSYSNCTLQNFFSMTTFQQFAFVNHCTLFLQSWTDFCLYLQRINPIPQHILKIINYGTELSLSVSPNSSLLAFSLSIRKVNSSTVVDCLFQDLR